MSDSWWNIKGSNLEPIGYEPSAPPIAPMFHSQEQSIHSPPCHRYRKEMSISKRTPSRLIPCKPRGNIFTILHLVAPVLRRLQACLRFFLRAINVYQFRAVLCRCALPFALERKAADYKGVDPLAVLALHVAE